MPILLSERVEQKRTSWLDTVFEADIPIVRRNKHDVAKYCGTERFINEVRKRGLHLIEVGDQFVVLPNKPLLIHC